MPNVALRYVSIASVGLQLEQFMILLIGVGVSSLLIGTSSVRLKWVRVSSFNERAAVVAHASGAIIRVLGFFY